MRRLRQAIRAVVIGGWVSVSICPALDAAEPAAAPAPTPSGSSPTDALIRQLGDADFRQREAAVAKLKSLGPSVLPELKKARETVSDPEIASRADGIIRRFERPRVPDRLAGTARRFGGGGRVEDVRIRLGVADGVKRIEVNEPGRSIRIEEGPNGIQMSVTGQEDGKEVERNFQARTPEQLKEKNPEAFELYQQFSGGVAGVLRNRARRPLGERIDRVPRRRSAVELLPVHPLPDDDLVADNLREMGELLRRNEQEKIRGLLEEMRREVDRLRDEQINISPRRFDLEHKTVPLEPEDDPN